MRASDVSAKVTLQCAVCGNDFQRYRSQVKWRGARYCSRECMYSPRADRRRATCVQCGETFERLAVVMERPGRGKFCSRQCYYAAKSHNRRANRVSLTCGECGRQFERVAAWVRKAKNFYCSRQCASTARRRGPQLPRRGAAWVRLAEQIRERDGRCCVRCGEPEDPAFRLQVDHVIPARLLLDFPEAADLPINLAALCAACHCLKTHRYEPRILRGDMLAIQEFYDAAVRRDVVALLNDPAEAVARYGDGRRGAVA